MSITIFLSILHWHSARLRLTEWGSDTMQIVLSTFTNSELVG